MEKFDKLSRYADYFSFVDYFFVHILRNQFPSVIGKYFPPPPSTPFIDWLLVEMSFGQKFIRLEA
jgi:hypothetical protein